MSTLGHTFEDIPPDMCDPGLTEFLYFQNSVNPQRFQRNASISTLVLVLLLTFLVQELKGRGQVANDITGLLFGKSNTILDVVQ